MKYKRNVLHETEISDYHQPSYTASLTCRRIYETEYLHNLEKTVISQSIFIVLPSPKQTKQLWRHRRIMTLEKWAADLGYFSILSTFLRYVKGAELKTMQTEIIAAYHTVPASTDWANIMAVLRSFVTIPAASPQLVLLALSMTSFRVLNLRTHCTGPKI